jgi:bifunctional UDP-N-acetylglucosamine pyrophosphorylase/glucosamine-1-phosphate N-acetyltransferase
MDAILLAAGLGTRLRPHTLTTPKPLLPVRGRPILDWTLRALPASIDRVLVVVHYLAEQIDTYLALQQHIPEWVSVRQEKPRGTGDAVRCCREHLRSDRFLVLNGDDLYGAADLDQLSRCPAGLLVHPVDEPSLFGIAFLRPNGTLDHLKEKPPLTGRQLANIGAYLFPGNVFEIELHESARGEYEVTDYVTALASREPVHVVQASFWLPIGNVEAWERAQNEDLETIMKRPT